MSGFFKSSIGRKVTMALSALFLMLFLLIHISINTLSVFSPSAFNAASHFMGTNWVVQFVMQPILLFGVVYHFVMGFILEIRNKKTRGIAYTRSNAAANATWMSRNMIYSGAAILAFITLHFLDFWIPEITHKYIDFAPEDATHYFRALRVKFENPYRVGVYVVAFFFLALHLLHGFTSAFQSMGSTAGRKKILQTVGTIYAVAIPSGFVMIALFHYFNR